MLDRGGWFSELRYGLFMHYGLYSLLGRGEWALNREQIPVAEYKKLKDKFTAEKFDAEKICDLAVKAGMRYVNITTMHHDGFCLYDTKLTDFNSVNSPAKRDLVAETVAAARKRGLKIELYHSLNNWTEKPDAVDALESRKAYNKFIDNTFERILELVTMFNPIDVLWYDGWWPFDAKGWHAEEMNKMVRSIQPHIIFNGRNGLPGDFSTPEGHLGAPKPWRPWEACICLNNSWAHFINDNEWKNPSQVVDMLSTVARGEGNLLLDVGPLPDGSFPRQAIEILTKTGAWLRKHGECVYDTDLFTMDLHVREGHRADWNHFGPTTASGDNLYLFARRWPGKVLNFGGLQCKVKKVSLLGTGKTFNFRQDKNRVVVTGLPEKQPDPICPVIKFECDGPPVIYQTGGLRIPRVKHPHYDPCPSDLLN